MAIPEFTPLFVGHVGVVVGIVVSLLFLGLWIYRNDSDIPGIGTLLFLVALAILWELQLLAIFFSSDPAVLKALSYGEKFTGFMTTLVWFVFVSKYTRKDFHRRRWVQAAFLGKIAILTVPIFLLPVRDLLIRDMIVHAGPGTPFAHAELVRGPLYYFALLVNYVIVTVAMVTLMRFLLRTRRGAWPRIALLILGASGVGVLNNLSIFGYLPVAGFNYGGFGALPFAAATAIAVVRFRLLDIVPVARSTLVESIDDAVFVVDEGRLVIDYNQSAVEMLPTESDPEGESLERVWPELSAHVDLPVTEHENTRILLEVDGRPRHFSVLVSPIRKSDADRPLGFSLLLRDVTELESSRQQLREQNRRLDQVAETISHDLRNPLTVASGHLDILAESVDREGMRSVEEIRYSHERMNDIIDDVLLLAREDGELEQSTVELGSTAREAWDNVDTGGAGLVLDGDRELVADRSKLLRVFENLFRNAVEHGVDGDPRTAADHGETADGDVPLTVTVAATEDGFAVEDDGSGIPPDERDDVFEFGYTTSSSGTGLGLSIVHRLVEVHDWTISLDPGGTGARFVVSGVRVPDTSYTVGDVVREPSE